MIRTSIAAVTACSIALSLAGCGKDEASPVAAATAATAVGAAAKPATTATAAATSGVDQPAAQKATPTKKLPEKSAAKRDEGKGKKGGDGDKSLDDKSHKAADKTVNATDRKKAEGENPCADLPDGVAECSGDELHFCDDKQHWVLDCGDHMPAAYPDTFSAGTCFETEAHTDCMGAGVASDGVVDFCNSDLSECCDETGDCYLFH